MERTLAEVPKTVSSLAQAKASNEVQVELRRAWHKLTAEQAEKRWLELRSWVEWLVVRDNIGSKEIPDCWYVHGGLVDELEAFRWACIACNKPDSKMSDPIGWRELLQRAACGGRRSTQTGAAPCTPKRDRASFRANRGGGTFSPRNSPTVHRRPAVDCPLDVLPIFDGH